MKRKYILGITWNEVVVRQWDVLEYYVWDENTVPEMFKFAT